MVDFLKKLQEGKDLAAAGIGKAKNTLNSATEKATGNIKEAADQVKEKYLTKKVSYEIFNDTPDNCMKYFKTMVEEDINFEILTCCPFGTNMVLYTVKIVS